MKNTIVTEWNLVCDDNFKRAHAHLFYSFGFLFGCLLGGFASDRYLNKKFLTFYVIDLDVNLQ